MEKDLDRKILIVFWITVVGLLSSLVFHYLLSLRNDVYPYNTFLFRSDASYGDFLIVLKETVDLNPYLGNHSAQYPLLCVVGFLLRESLKVFPASSYLYFIWVLLCVGIYFRIVFQMSPTNRPAFSSVALCLCFLLSYPFLFAVGRGNFELLVFVTVAASFYAYRQSRFYLAGVLLACAASMKLFPIYYLVIFLKDRRYKEIAWTLGIIVSMNLALIALFKGGLLANLQYLMSGGNVQYNTAFTDFTDGTPIFQWSVSLYSLVKVMLAKFGLLHLYEKFDILLYYKVFMIVVVAFLSMYVVFKVKDFFLALTISTIVVVLLPYLSADYKMIYLFLPIGYYFYEKERRFQVAYSILFGMAIIPKSYYYLGLTSDSSYSDVTIALILNPLLLACILGLALYESTQQKRPGETVP